MARLRLECPDCGAVTRVTATIDSGAEVLRPEECRECHRPFDGDEIQTDDEPPE